MKMLRITSLLFGLCLMPMIAVRPVNAQGESGDLLGRTNSLRAQRGLGAYSLNGALSAAAQSQAQWIIETGSVSHTRPDGSGPRTRALAAGYPSTDVNENIYGGTMATASDAWTFWVNSGVHLAALINQTYSEVGIGVARGDWGAAFVMVFGNPGGAPPPPPPPPPGQEGQAVSAGGGGASAPAGEAAYVPPSYFLGYDEQGNILHLVQPGDTLGDIALIYGFTWDDLPRLLEHNGLGSVYDLEPGMTFKVPPNPRMYTPTTEPTDGPSPTPAPTSTPGPTITPFVAVLEPTLPNVQLVVVASPTATLTPVVVTLTPTPETTVEAVAVAQVSTPVAAVPTTAPIAEASAASSRGNPSPILVVALLAQVAIIAAAGYEFIRRSRAGRR